MTEKEFLTEFAKRYERVVVINDDTITSDAIRKTFIDQFLKQIHCEYFEVEFVKKAIGKVKNLKETIDLKTEEIIKLKHQCQCEVCDPQL